MEEKNTKTAAAKKDGKSLKRFYNKYAGEFKKIIWPSRSELIKQTITVICLSLIIGVIIWGYDTVFTYLYEALVNLVKK